MKIVLSFLAISTAAAASQDGSFIRGGSSASTPSDDSAVAAATHQIPDDLFAGLENPDNDWTPQEYCPRGTKYNNNGPEWPPESGCYPGTGSISPGYPKCCDKGNCPSNSRPLCENSMAGAPDYCANMGPLTNCYAGGWPNCCLTDGLSCPNNPPPCDRDTQRCNSSSDCRSSEYCLKQVSNCGQTGQCVMRPDVCSQVNDPVCGCDGKTYSNQCTAAANGKTSVKYFGKCDGDDDDGPNDSCSSNRNCQDDEYCDFPDGDCGDNTKGECKSIPSGQDCNGVANDKVCGCDGQEYKNSCKANQQGLTSVQNYGSCFNVAFE
mmetsp:Transcript_151/g.206  ORF Transcript_151/g.206 Transcript_151/m.206 type:complete len:321 (+) Transcript_151:106-1068(+)